MKVHGYIGVNRCLFLDPFVKHIFQNFELFLANRALKVPVLSSEMDPAEIRLIR
jgi:hypothetical protein